MRLHVWNAHRAPFPGAQKQDRKRDMAKTLQNCTERAPGERWGCPKELQARSREPQRRPNGRQRPPQRSIVAPWLCPSVLESTLWMVSLRNVRSDPKLHSASQRVPRRDQWSPRELQERLERAPGTTLNEYSGAQPPQSVTKIEDKGRPRTFEKPDPPFNK